MSTGALYQYIIVRRDLIQALNWNTGSVIAQACHASTAALWMFRNEQRVQSYLSLENLASMHKVVLEIKNETQLLNLAKKLEERQLNFYLWLEKPENIPTAIATQPYLREEFGDLFRRYQLFK
eukprot:TRINITY_DN689_c0_g1_i1.p1 TRINITY_DN689_c0_g1~~TRINITY_DN689_c0_g1_i1.p1  ORF type:complete len:123 (-),score=48.55 TRINITY_DN689_c0_g1_i1:191-559(-)